MTGERASERERERAQMMTKIIETKRIRMGKKVNKEMTFEWKCEGKK